MNIPAEIQNYVSQMAEPDNSVKLDVQEHLHTQIGKLLALWRNEKTSEMLAAAKKYSGSHPPHWPHPPYPPPSPL